MIKQFRTTITVLFTLAFLFAGNGFAQEKLTFGDFDKNNNQAIERDEFIATYTKHFMDQRMGHGSMTDKDMHQEHMEKKKDADRKDWDRKDEEHKDADRNDWNRKDADRKEWDRKDADRNDWDRKDVGRQDMDRDDNYGLYLNERDFNKAVYRVWDGDTDNQISKEEYKDEFGREFAGFVDESFERVDANNDGFVAFVEYENETKDTGKFYDWDIDGDMKLNPAELAIGTFNTWDIDGSGYLDRNEYNRFDRYYLEF